MLQSLTANRIIVLLTLMVGCVLVLVMATPARAQSNAHVAVGADVTKRVFTKNGFDESIKPSLLYRIRKHRHPENGWRFRAPEFGFNWFGADVEMRVGGQNTEIGHLNVRPLLAGVAEAYVAHGGRDELSITLLAGPAFSRFSVSAEAREAYRQRLGADPVAIDAKNTFVVRPGVSYWRDLGSRLGFHAAINYIIARPEVVIRTPAGETKSRWTADNVAFKAGLAVGLF
jgi:hypothetical protein